VAAAPLSTYRLQLRPGFGFDEAAAVAGYLADLGVTHVYCSPYLQAASGSTHGYDVVDHSRVNEELGGAEAHARMVKTFEQHGLGQVLDIVPNHMAIAGRANRWWWDVLENGPASVYAAYFDVDWDPPESKLRDRVLLPVLGDHYGRVLEAGEITLSREGGGFVVRYHEHEAPVAPRSLDVLLARASARCGSDELESLAAGFGRLPHATLTDRANTEARHRDKEVLRTQLARLLDEDDEAAAAVDAVVAETNADVDALDQLLDSSTSPPSLACAPRTSWSSPTPTPSCCGGFATASSAVCASTIPTDCATPRATWAGWPTRPVAAGSWSRRSSSRASACATRGRSRARRATTSSIASAACSWIRPGRSPSPSWWPS
jgi:maltooligosyltrehalose synthase